MDGEHSGHAGDPYDARHDPTNGVADRAIFLAELPARLRDAISADELRTACSAPVIGLRAREMSTTLWIGDRRPTSPLPIVELTLDPPVDATWLAGVWGIERPVAVSGDVHQERWHLLVAGEDLPDPYRRRIAADPPTAGRWAIDVVLDGRPPGPLPEVVCGASPAYDLRTVGGRVVALSIERAWIATELVAADHPDVVDLSPPAPPPPPTVRWWLRRRRTGGPTVAPSFVVVRDGGAPAAVAGFRIGRDELTAFSFAVATTATSMTTTTAGAALLDALEALALAEGVRRVRVDASAATVRHVVPFDRYGPQWAAALAAVLDTGRSGPSR